MCVLHTLWNMKKETKTNSNINILKVGHRHDHLKNVRNWEWRQKKQATSWRCIGDVNENGENIYIYNSGLWSVVTITVMLLLLLLMSCQGDKVLIHSRYVQRWPKLKVIHAPHVLVVLVVVVVVWSVEEDSMNIFFSSWSHLRSSHLFYVSLAIWTGLGICSPPPPKTHWRIFADHHHHHRRSMTPGSASGHTTVASTI